MVVEAEAALVNVSDHYKRLFQKHASKEINGDRFMSKDDFLDAVAPGEDFKKIERNQFALLFRLADKGEKGYLSFNDFIIFQNLLSKPDAEYEIAFKLFDSAGSGKITFDQFKQVLSSNLPPEAVPFDFDCDWLKLYIGNKEGHHELTYAEFTQLLKGLQGERLRQEFKHYDKKQTGYIEPDHFQQIILDIAKHKLSDNVIEQLPTLCNLYAGNKITFSNVVAFHNVVRSMDMVESIIRKAITSSADKKITKQDFLYQAAQSTRYSLFTPMEADIIFHFAGADNSTGRLSLEDFAKILDPRWKIPEQLPSEVKPEDVSAKKRGFGWDIIESAYAFTLGAIAGAVGATAVYPIDLVKTRMQNQRSKVVGELLYKNSIDCFKKVVRNEGFAGLYRGLGPQLVVSKFTMWYWFPRGTKHLTNDFSLQGVAPEKAIKLTVNDLIRGKLKNKTTGEIQFWEEMVAGGTAGASQVVSGDFDEYLRRPFSLKRTFVSLGLYKSSRDCQDSIANSRRTGKESGCS